jgi:AraC-like DNA-binding protein
LKRRFHERSRSVIYSWILSYLMLALVTTVLTGVVYIIARNTIEAEINYSNRLLLENIRDNIDATLAVVQDLSMDILSSQEIQSAGNLRVDASDPNFYYRLYKAAQSLKNYKIYKDPLQNFYIYLGNIGRVIRPGIVNFEANYYRDYIQAEDFSYEQWLEVMGEQHYGDYVFIPYTASARGTLRLAHMRSLPSVSPEGPVSNIVIMMDFSDILDYGAEGRSLVILDGEGRILAQGGLPTPFDATDLPGMENGHGIFSRSSNGDKQVISYIASRRNNWKYITVTPEYVFWQKASYIRDIMWGEIVLCVIGMGLLSFYFVRRNYNILREITSFVRARVRSEMVWKGDEFSYIRQALSASIEDKEAAESLLGRQAPALRENLLVSLLEGRERSVPLEELLSICDVRFPHQSFCVLVAHIENVNDELWQQGHEEGLDVFELARIAVKNVLEEILGRIGTAYTVESHELTQCILNTPLSAGEFRQTIESSLKDVKDFVAQNLDVDICLAVSRVYKSPEDIHFASSEAQSAIDSALVLGRTAFFEDIGREQAEISGSYPLDKERQILNHIRLGDGEAAAAIVRELFRDRKGALESQRLLTLLLCSGLLRGVDAGERDFGNSLKASRGLLQRMIHGKTIGAIREAMLDFTRNLAGQELLRRGDCSLSAQVKAEVLKHYADPSLGIASIAETIGKSPYYISKLFKVETGSGILDFIGSVRVGRGKELLLTGELTQEQIAEQVGFTNVRTFQRAFKKVEGVPPGKLRSGLHI